MTNQEEVYMSKLANFHMVKPEGMCFCTRMCFCARAWVLRACVFSARVCVCVCDSRGMVGYWVANVKLGAGDLQRYDSYLLLRSIATNSIVYMYSELQLSQGDTAVTLAQVKIKEICFIITIIAIYM